MLLTKDKLSILKSIRLFSQIPEKELVWLATELEEVEYEADDTIISQGDLGTSMFIIVQGEVNVIVDDKFITKLSHNQFFGELAALDPEPRSATIKASTKVLLLRVDRNVLFDLMVEYRNIGKGIIKALCNRIRETN